MRPDPTPRHVRHRVLERHRRLLSKGYHSYAEYLNSQAWRTLQARYRRSSRPQECFCGTTENLELHHLTYARVGGDERLTDLLLLCSNCHRLVHVLEARREIELNCVGLTSPERAARFPGDLEGQRTEFAEALAEFEIALDRLARAVQPIGNRYTRQRFRNLERVARNFIVQLQRK